jgi:uncharacterized protein (DUF58 family)
MKFLITGRGFLLPALAGTALLLRNWLPHADLLCVMLNLAGLFCLSVDYFLVPDPKAFEFTRLLPAQFFIGKRETVIIRIEYAIALPIKVIFVDHPPAEFEYDDRRFTGWLKPGEGAFEFSYFCTPGRRGEFHYKTAGMRLSSPFGLVARQLVLSIENIVNVYPCLPSEKEGLQSKFYMAQTESRQIKMYGPGREFSQMREYRRGDDIKNIHWKKSARCGRLIVKEYAPELGQNIFVMIDGGRLMMAETGGLSKVDWAVASAISLAREALAMKDSVGIMGFSNTIDTFLLPSNKKIQLSTLVKTIYAFQPRFIEPDYGNAFSWMHTHVKMRSIVIIYTDFIDPLLSNECARFISLLKKRHRVICCALGFENLETLGYTPSETLDGAVFSSVVRDSIYNRKKVIGELAGTDVDVIDVVPEKLCASVLNCYVNARWKG